MVVYCGIKKSEPRYEGQDFIDPEDARVKPMIDTLFGNARPPTDADKIKLRLDNLQQFFPPAYDQLDLLSCAPNAAASVVEYYSLVKRKMTWEVANRKSLYRPLSRLFIYYNARRLINQWQWESGAPTRTTLGALKLFGAPYENFWSYLRDDYAKEPTPFVYSLAAANKIDSYILHEFDTREKIIQQVKKYLIAGVPSVANFILYEFYDDNKQRNAGAKEGELKEIGTFPYPDDAEEETDRHCVVVTGFDDNARIINHKGKETKGAFKIRNSWSTGWGENGYGWLPYDYVRNDKAFNFWSLLWMNLMEIKDFGITLDTGVLPRPR